MKYQIKNSVLFLGLFVSSSAFANAPAVVENYNQKIQAGDSSVVLVLQDYLERLAKIHVRSDELVKEFDEELARGNDPMATANYQDLQVYYHMHKSLVENIGELHSYLSTVSQGFGFKAEMAKTVLAQFNSKLASLSSFEKVVYQELLQKIDKRNVNSGLFEAYENQLAFEKGWMQTSKNLPELGGDLDNEFRVQKVRMVLQQAPAQPAKKLNAYPDAGVPGRLDGNNFPSDHWALTYDDGPHDSNTMAILSILDQYKVKATFFWLSRITSQPGFQSIISAVKASGHDLANHSHSHANLEAVGEAALQREIVNSQTLHASAYGLTPQFFRCPYGNCGQNYSRIRQLIASQNMMTVQWNVDSLDWQDHNPASVVRRIRSQMSSRGGGIILMHDIQNGTVSVTNQLIPQLVSEGRYKFLTMSQAMSLLNP